MIIGYILAYVIIGLAAGLVSRRYMPGAAVGNSRGLMLFGAVGSGVGGLLGYGLIAAGWQRSQQWGTGTDYAYVDSSHMVPVYWLSLAVALCGALLVLAGYKLLRDRILRP